ncbi:hypothetical protein [Streptomyces sp. NPDC053427]|uniref:hypothetical protein n=1 Tax=Streptomyces sp. NPDC053427 TaxID=3365701 RepID=UPI0037CFD570
MGEQMSSHGSIGQTEKKSKSQVVREKLWESPAYFIVLAWLLLIWADIRDAPNEVGWYVYFAGWTPWVLMMLWTLGTRRKPDSPAAWVGLSVLVFCGLVNLVFHHESLPF